MTTQLNKNDDGWFWLPPISGTVVLLFAVVCHVLLKWQDSLVGPMFAIVAIVALVMRLFSSKPGAAYVKRAAIGVVILDVAILLACVLTGWVGWTILYVLALPINWYGSGSQLV